MTFTTAVTDHDASDAAGDVLGVPESQFWRGHQSSKINAIRIRTLITNCDVAVIRFGSKYKQWNAAFDAGYCAALGKPYITLHDEDLIHALKEVDGPALGPGRTSAQVGRPLGAKRFYGVPHEEIDLDEPDGWTMAWFGMPGAATIALMRAPTGCSKSWTSGLISIGSP